jgi:hypothetical protein
LLDLYDEVVELAKQSPDFKYSTDKGCKCFYTCGPSDEEQNNGCLIGQALVKLYPERYEDLKKLDESGQEISFSSLDNYISLEWEYDNGFDLADSLINAIQLEQDKANCWKDAVVHGVSSYLYCVEEHSYNMLEEERDYIKRRLLQNLPTQWQKEIEDHYCEAR